MSDNLIKYLNPIILETVKCGVTRDYIITGDRETSKTTTAFYIAKEFWKNEKTLFCYICKHEKQFKMITPWLRTMGWYSKKEVIYEKEEIVGFICAINTSDNTKIAGYRNFNIKMAIFDEIISEKKIATANEGESVSSTLSSIFGKNKLKNWKELGLIIMFLANNINANHPLFYLYGIPQTTGVEFRRNKKVALISLVDPNPDDIDEILTLGDYNNLAYGKSGSPDESILINPDYDNWIPVFIFEISGIEGTFLKKDNFVLLSSKIFKTNYNKIINLANDELTLKPINLNLLIKLNRGLLHKKVFFDSWKIKRLLIGSIIKNLKGKKI